MSLPLPKAPVLGRIQILKTIHYLCGLVSMTFVVMACLEPFRRAHPITTYFMQYLQSGLTGNNGQVDEFDTIFIGVQIFVFYLICALIFGEIARLLINGKGWREAFRSTVNCEQKQKVDFNKCSTRSTYVEIDGQTFGFVARVVNWPGETDGPRLVLGQLYTPIKGKRLDQHEFGPLEWYRLQIVSGTFLLHAIPSKT